MDSPVPPTILSPNTPRMNPRVHPPSRPSSRLSSRERHTDDILTDLTPSTTFEAFTSPSGKLRASIEAASQSERAFGIRATLASKKIQEWVNELSGWPWPVESGSAGFEMPAAKRRKISDEANGSQELEYSGSLLTADALQYETRLEEITGDMEDLHFEEIKRQVLDTHFSAKSRPSSSASSAPMPSFLSSYTKMDDFTAIVTATVLQALPNLSRLMRLMEVWNIRLAVLQKVPPLLTALDDTEVALKSGWSAMQVPDNHDHDSEGAQALSRDTFNVMKSVLQDKVTSLGQDLDYMLDTLEGRPDTLPDSWLDRMEAIEQDYGEWAVAGDRRVREGEWARMAKARKEAEDARRAKEAEEAEAARLKAEKDAEVARILAEEQAAEAAKRKAEKDAEVARILAEEQAAEAAKRKAEEDSTNARILAEKQAAEAARRKVEQDADDERLRVEQLIEEARLETEREEASARILAQEQAIASAKRKANEDAANTRKLQEEQIADVARRKAEQDERLKQFRLKTEQDEEAARILAEEQAAKLKADEDAANAKRFQEELIADAARRKAKLEAEDERIKTEQLAEELRLKTEKDAEDAAESSRQQTMKDAADAKRLEEEQALEAARRKEETDAEDAKRIEAEAAEKLSQQQARRDTEEAARIFEEAQTREAAQRQAELNAQNAEIARRQAIVNAEKEQAAERDTKAEVDRQNEDSVNAAAVKKQPTHIAFTETIQRDEEPIALRTPPVSVTGLASTVDTPSIDTDSEANESTYSRDFASQLEKFAPFDGSSDVHPVASDVPVIQNQVLQPGQNGNAKTSRPANIGMPPVNSLGNLLQTPRTSSPSSNDAAQTRKTPRTAPADNRIIQDRSSPSTPKSKLRLGHAYAEFVRHSLPSTPTKESSRRSPDFPKSSVISSPNYFCMNADHALISPVDVFPDDPMAAQETHELSEIPLVGNVTKSQDSILANVPTDHGQDIESVDHILASTETGDSELVEIDDSILPIHHSKNSSVLGYSISQTALEILEAEPAEYFRPTLSPIESPRFSIQGSEPATPTVSRTFVSDAGENSFSTLDEDEEMSSSTPQRRAGDVLSSQESITLPSMSDASDAVEVQLADNTEDSLENSQICDIGTPFLARRSSPSPIDTGIKLISLARPHSSSSETPTIVTGFEGSASTPMIPSSPLSAERESFPEVEPESPSAGRVGLRNNFHDYSPPGSPAPMRAIRKRGSLPSPTSPTFSILDQSDTSSLSIDAPSFSTSDLSDTSSLTDAPIFDNVQVSADRSMNAGPTKTSSDQLEQQISSILDSIPTKIRLTSKPDAHQANTLRLKKTRRSVTPSLRSHSSMSNYSRAPTPSFLLSPDQSQNRSRPRPQNGAPETKLYHLSRSNGEAPIKLLVRLVGENGERVMVRVGGGWADLGEYLKEYASHHGRRNVNKDKIEIQDLPSSRNVSGASTVRGNGNGRSTPLSESRPVSAFDRPMSSLNVRKTRMSMGESDIRSPSTPLPMMNRPVFNETPPSGPVRSSSRMSSIWAEDDSSLGLAGPKSKKVAISERDQEWVESMKEKVRQASAEKERREKDKEFGQMERAGGTKRLFRKT